MYKRENDWWIESGGPPVTNEGQVAKLVEMTQNDEGPVLCQCNQIITSKKSFIKVTIRL